MLVYVTGGISKTGIDNQAQLEASINAAVKANVAIYPIDARGLMADPPGGGASKGASRGTGIYNGSAYNSQRAGINNSQETLATLAADTGGKVFLDSNDLSLGIVQAQQRVPQLLHPRLLHHQRPPPMASTATSPSSSITASRPSSKHRHGYYADKVWGKFNGAG